MGLIPRTKNKNKKGVNIPKMDYKDCNFNEALATAFQIETSSNGTTRQDFLLLKKNTESLNERIGILIRNNAATIKSAKLSPLLRREFQDRIPVSALADFKRQSFQAVGDLVTYVTTTPALQIDYRSEAQVLAVLVDLDPNVLQPFGPADYPLIYSRVQSGNQITTVETQQLISANGLDGNAFADYLTRSSLNLMRMLERVLEKIGLGAKLMGSFCSLIDNVYGVNSAVQNPTARTADASQAQLQSVLGTISPRLGEITSTIQSIRSSVAQIQEDSGDMQSRMQAAFQLLATALNISLSFYNPETKAPATVSLAWDYPLILSAINSAISGDVNLTALFLTAVVDSTTGRKLGDINDDGVVTSADTDLLQIYINSPVAFADLKAKKYILDTMTQFMTENMNLYEAYTIYSSSATASSAQLSATVSSLSRAASLFGSAGNPSAGDFGAQNLNSLQSALRQVESGVQSLTGSAPMNIDSILSQIQEIRSLSTLVSDNIFSDSRATLEEFRNTTDSSLALAESLSVTDPTRTRDIQEGRTTAVGENVTRALNLSARTTSEIGPLLSQQLSGLENQIQSAAATGILERIEAQIEDVVQSAASDLESVVESFNPSSLSNGYDYNMSSVFSRYSGLRTNALAATSPESVEHTQSVLRNSLLENTRSFRQLNRPDVEFIALRFCNMAGEIERLYSSLAAPLSQMVTQASEVNSRLSVSGNAVSSAAIRAGAFRLPSSSRPAFGTTASQIAATISRGGGLVPLNSSGDPFLPNTSNGTSPVLPMEYSDLPRFVDVEGGRSWNGLMTYHLGGRTIGRLQASGMPRNMGWDGIFLHGGINHEGINMLRRFVQVCLAWRSQGNSTPLTVNSAYRPGDTVASSGNLSFHSRGIALDVSLPSSQQIAFATLARSKGFRGIGLYPNFIHIDTGSERSWRG